MKTNLKMMIVAVAITFVAVSCGSKSAPVDAALAQIEKALDKVEKNKTSMTEADWTILSEELEQPSKVLQDALENNQVGLKTKIKIASVLKRYALSLQQAAFHTFKESLPAVTNQLQEVLGEDEMKQALEELQKAMDSLSPQK